jgi:hypothetical protein
MEKQWIAMHRAAGKTIPACPHFGTNPTTSEHMLASATPYFESTTTVSVQNGTSEDESFDLATHLFTLDVSVNQFRAVESESNPVRSALVEFTFGTPSGQSHRD